MRDKRENTQWAHNQEILVQYDFLGNRAGLLCIWNQWPRPSCVCLVISGSHPGGLECKVWEHCAHSATACTGESREKTDQTGRGVVPRTAVRVWSVVWSALQKGTRSGLSTPEGGSRLQLPVSLPLIQQSPSNGPPTTGPDQSLKGRKSVKQNLIVRHWEELCRHTHLVFVAPSLQKCLVRHYRYYSSLFLLKTIKLHHIIRLLQ